MNESNDVADVHVCMFVGVHLRVTLEHDELVIEAVRVPVITHSGSITPNSDPMRDMIPQITKGVCEAINKLLQAKLNADGLVTKDDSVIAPKANA